MPVIKKFSKASDFQKESEVREIIQKMIEDLSNVRIHSIVIKALKNQT